VTAASVSIDVTKLAAATHHITVDVSANVPSLPRDSSGGSLAQHDYHTVGELAVDSRVASREGHVAQRLGTLRLDWAEMLHRMQAGSSGLVSSVDSVRHPHRSDATPDAACIVEVCTHASQGRRHADAFAEPQKEAAQSAGDRKDWMSAGRGQLGNDVRATNEQARTLYLDEAAGVTGNSGSEGARRGPLKVHLGLEADSGSVGDVPGLLQTTLALRMLSQTGGSGSVCEDNPC
jgi:hypothetical protein